MIEGNVTDRYADDANYVAGRYLNLSDDDGNTYPLVDAFARGYAQAMLWANTYMHVSEDDYIDADGENSIENVDLAYAYISPGEWWNDIGIDFSDAIDFLANNYEAIVSLSNIPGIDPRAYSWEQHGHDFALTRNGHGAGFWDRGYGEIGDTLSEAARAYGAHTLYVSSDIDDHRIWNEG